MLDKIFKSEIVIVSLIIVLLSWIGGASVNVLYTLNIYVEPFWTDITIFLGIFAFLILIISYIYSLKGNKDASLIFTMAIIISLIFRIFLAIWGIIFNFIDYINILITIGMLIFVIFVYKDFFYKGMFDRQFRKAIKFGKNRDYDKALEIYNELLKNGKNYPRLHYNISHIFLRNNDFEKALSQIDIVLEIKPKYTDAQILKAYILNNIGKYEEALEYYNEILKNSYNDEGFKGKIKSLIYLDRENEALNLIDDSLKNNKNNLRLIQLKANVLRNICEFEKALKCINKILSEDKNNSEALYTKSSLLNDLGRYSEVLDTLNNYLASIDTDDKYSKSLYWYIKGAICVNFNKEKSLEAYEKSLSLNFHIQVLMNKIRILKDLDRLEECKKCSKTALEFVNDELRLNPHNLDLLLHKVRIFTYIEEYDKANEFLESIKINSTDKHSLSQKGYLLGKLGRYDEAIACIDQALKIIPNSPDFLWNKAYILDKMNKFDEALEFYDKALNITPKVKELQEDRDNLLKKIKKNDILS
ncbi:MAG: tetratricopeptide repeat protein [Methanobrevibacter sp.]|nr:tetratricopeptide repeat protein [Methanobrevibacter sp.]